MSEGASVQQIPRLREIKGSTGVLRIEEVERLSKILFDQAAGEFCGLWKTRPAFQSWIVEETNECRKEIIKNSEINENSGSVEDVKNKVRSEIINSFAERDDPAFNDIALLLARAIYEDDSAV